MSDKVVAVRVNGVTKDLGGSGSGTVGGAYLAPTSVFSSEKLGFYEYLIDWDNVAEQFELAGINLDDELTNDIEDDVEIMIALSTGINSLNNPATISTIELFRISVSSHSGEDSGHIYFNTYIEVLDYNETSLAQFNQFGEGQKPVITYRILFAILRDQAEVHSSSIPSMFDESNKAFVGIGNQIAIHRFNINESEFYNLPNVEAFCEEVYIESGSGSSGSSN